MSAQAPQEAAHADIASTFPSSKKAYVTHAPIYAALLVTGIILGALLATSWARLNKDSASAHASQEAAGVALADKEASAKASTPQALSVLDQKAGQSVAIQSLNLSKPTWVVVYVSREGKPGNALGARLYFPGDSKGSVGLLRNTQPNQIYIVGLSVDNGDRVFSLNADKPMPDADGGPLWATFRAL